MDQDFANRSAIAAQLRLQQKQELRMLFQGQKRTLQLTLHKILDEIVTKYEEHPKKVTKPLSAEAKRYHDVPVATCVSTSAEVIQMFHNFWEHKELN